MNTSAHYFKDYDLTSSHYVDELPILDAREGRLKYTSVNIHNAVEVKHEVTVLKSGKAVTTITVTDDAGVKNEVVIFHK
jgi:hypothetical protein